MDPAIITAALNAAGTAIGLFDKIADQVERFISKRPGPDEPTTHRMRIQKAADSIESKYDGQTVKTITGEDLAKLPESQLRHITTFERSMEAHYGVWARVYPQLASMDSPVQRARVEQQLAQVIRDMKGDLEAILSFLEACGLELDDHYQHVRHLVADYA